MQPRSLVSLALFLIVALPPWAIARGEPSGGANEEAAVIQAHIKKGFRHLRGQRYNKAIEELEKARDLSSEPCVRCLNGIALSYYRAEMFEQAIEPYEELFELEPEVVSLLRRLVQIYDRVGKPEKASAAYKIFLENSDTPGEMVTIYNELGVRHLNPDSGLGVHRGDAAAAFRSALGLAGGRSNLLRRNLAEALWQLGSKDEALNVLDGLAPDDEENWGLLPAVERNPTLVAKEQRVRSDWMPEALPPSGSLALGNDDPSGPGREAMYVGGDIRAPEKIYFPQPQYTEIARKGRVQGVVIAQVLIDEQGDVQVERILKGLSSGLNEEAVKAISKWKFRPATLNGKPVAVYYNLTVNFRLQ